MKLLVKIMTALTLTATLTLAACGSGGDTGTTNPPSSVFAKKTALAAGDPHCANGGVQIDMGFDNNGNNELDTDEITNTEYVCNGADGTNGTNGADSSSHPFVVYTSPTPNESDVELDAAISAVFNTEMDINTINDTTFTVKDAAGNPVAGTVTYSGIVAVFQPVQSLVMNTKYTVTLSSAIENDAAGIAMGYDHKVFFATGDRATVKYMANGADSGTVPVDSGKYAANDIATVLGKGDLANGTLNFAGWNTRADGNGTTYTAGAQIEMGFIDLTLYAKWVDGYDLGDIGPSGVGIVFYVTDGGLHGLEAASVDQSTVSTWSNITSVYIRATAWGIGTGSSNTNAIINQSGHTDSAAQICGDYRATEEGDWFLPSRDELNLMYENLHTIGVGGFAAGHYWSSSELDANYAWYQDFNNGNQDDSDKSGDKRVRAVRSF